MKKVVPEKSVLSTGGDSTVQANALRHFTTLVTNLGGNPDQLLRKSQIDPASLDDDKGAIPYRHMVQLLERAAMELHCPDFGMRLAIIQKDTKKVFGPLAFAMHNSPSVGEAFRYCAEHVQAYSAATQICLERNRAERTVFMRFEILLARVPHQRQIVEHALLASQLAALSISGGRAHAREIHLTHEALSPVSTYRTNFGAAIHFGQSANGLVFRESDFDMPIADPDPHLYEMATSFIEHRFPAAAQSLSTRVRTVIARLLVDGACRQEEVSSALGLHPRTLQRRLREEGESFESLKDSVRKDVALRYLKQADVPLTRVAEMLGYSETSVLSRNCHRWFSASPRQLRRNG